MMNKSEVDEEDEKATVLRENCNCAHTYTKITDHCYLDIYEHVFEIIILLYI